MPGPSTGSRGFLERILLRERLDVPTLLLHERGKGLYFGLRGRQRLARPAPKSRDPVPVACASAAVGAVPVPPPKTHRGTLLYFV